jgi:hypothetical protein
VTSVATSAMFDGETEVLEERVGSVKVAGGVDERSVDVFGDVAVGFLGGTCAGIEVVLGDDIVSCAVELAYFEGVDRALTLCDDDDDDDEVDFKGAAITVCCFCEVFFLVSGLI